MRSFSKRVLLALAVTLWAGVWGQPETRPAEPAATAPAEEVRAEAANAAVEFLKKVEESNKDLKTLHATFKQVREIEMFNEEVHSSGEFWYSKPNLFRCDYFEPSPVQIYLIKNKGYYYTPEIKQLDTFALESGGEAPIHGILVGFGLDIAKILDVFTVRMAPEQPADKDRVTVDFISRDTDRTLDFQQISVTFDRDSLEPRSLFMLEGQDKVKIDLVKVEKNHSVEASRFEANFPSDVTVIRR